MYMSSKQRKVDDSSLDDSGGGGGGGIWGQFGVSWFLGSKILNQIYAGVRHFVFCAPLGIGIGIH
jgi:hypothetical protein